MTLQRSAVTDTTDSAGAVIYEIPSPIVQPVRVKDEEDDGSLYEPCFEFSDNEMEIEEEAPRTRSQSRAKESSMPPAEPVRKVTRAKKVSNEENNKKPRRRRRIIEEVDADDD